MQEQAKKLAEQMYRKGLEDGVKQIDEKMYERQIQAVERLVEKTVDRFISEIFGPIARAFFTAQLQPQQANIELSIIF